MVFFFNFCSSSSCIQVRSSTEEDKDEDEDKTILLHNAYLENILLNGYNFKNSTKNIENHAFTLVINSCRLILTSYEEFNKEKTDTLNSQESLFKKVNSAFLAVYKLVEEEKSEAFYTILEQHQPNTTTHPEIENLQLINLTSVLKKTEKVLLTKILKEINTF